MATLAASKRALTSSRTSTCTAAAGARAMGGKSRGSRQHHNWRSTSAGSTPAAGVACVVVLVWGGRGEAGGRQRAGTHGVEQLGDVSQDCVGTLRLRLGGVLLKAHQDLRGSTRGRQRQCCLTCWHLGGAACAGRQLGSPHCWRVKGCWQLWRTWISILSAVLMTTMTTEMPFLRTCAWSK